MWPELAIMVATVRGRKLIATKMGGSHFMNAGRRSLSSRIEPAMLWTLLFIAIGLGGCGRRQDYSEPTAVLETPKNSSETLAAVPGVVPSEEEAVVFSQELELALGSADRIPFDRFIDYEAMFDRVVANLHLPSEIVSDERKRFIDRQANRTELVQRLQELVGRGSRYVLVRVYEADGERRALFRMTAPEFGGLNYYDMILGRDETGRIRAVDLHILLAGEKLSESLRRVTLPFVATRHPDLAEHFTGIAGDYIEHLKDVQAISTFKETKPEEAILAMRRLTPRLQREKALLVHRLIAAMKLNDAKEEDAARKAFQSEYPDDPTIDMISIRHFCRQNEFDRALAALDAIDTFVRGDPYLDSWRANILFQAGRYVEADKAAERAVSNVPADSDGYWSSIDCALRRNDADAVLTRLKRIDQSFKLEWDDLTKEDAYAEFVKSPQHSEWLRYLESKRQGTAPM